MPSCRLGLCLELCQHCLRDPSDGVLSAALGQNSKVARPKAVWGPYACPLHFIVGLAPHSVTALLVGKISWKYSTRVVCKHTHMFACTL